MSVFKAMLVRLVVTGAIALLPAELLASNGRSDQSPEQLQQRYFQSLKDIASGIRAQSFPYPFYLSRVLDADPSRVRLADEAAIRFASYKGQTVLVLTGNYNAAYSAERLDSTARLKESFERVIMPMLELELSKFTGECDFSAFAIEMSQHVRQEVRGLTYERPENIMVVMPIVAARRLVQAKTDAEKQAAVLDSQAFVNGQPQALWLGTGDPSDDWKRARLEMAQRDSGEPSGELANSDRQSSTPDLIQTAATSASLAELGRQYQSTTGRLIQALEEKAHLMASAAPAFVRFRQSVYLELSFDITLEATPGSSRYKLAALAFDEQISPLIAMVTRSFPPDVKFDGVSYRMAIKRGDGSSAEVVEFFLGFPLLRCFSSYDCTGQQLLDSGVTLINGARSALDLQLAEGKN